MSRIAIWRAAEVLVAPYYKDQRRKCSKLRAQGVCVFVDTCWTLSYEAWLGDEKLFGIVLNGAVLEICASDKTSGSVAVTRSHTGLRVVKVIFSICHVCFV